MKQLSKLDGIATCFNIIRSACFWLKPKAERVCSISLLKINHLFTQKRKQQAVVYGLMTFLWMFASIASFASNSFAAPIASLQEIKLTKLPDGNSQLQLILTKPIALPKSFMLINPDKLILDLPNINRALTENPTLTKDIAANGLIRGIDTAEDNNRTRVLLYLKQAAAYQVNTVGNKVVVNLQAVIPSTAPKVRQITQFEFKRDSNGGGQLLFSLSDSNSNVDFENKTDGLAVIFKDTQLDSSVVKRFDVTAFGTLVQSVTLTSQGKNAQAAIRINGAFNQASYLANKQFVVDIKPKSTNNVSNSGLDNAKYTGKRLTLNFQDLKVRAALQIIAEFTGLNLVTSESVKGSMTLRLDNVPWDQALEIILKTQGLAKRQFGNILFIAPVEEITSRETQELQAKLQLDNLAPLQAELLQISYGNAKDIADMLKDKSNTLLSARGSVSVDIRTNSIWIQDTPERIIEVRRLLQKLDIPVKQVIIEARIVNVTKNAARDLGIKWGVSSPNHMSGTLKGANALAAGTPIGKVDPADRLNLNLTGTSLDYASKPHATLGLALMKLGNTGLMLDLELSAMESENKGRIISTPRLVTANQQAAKIESGEEIPYQEASSSGAATTSFKKAVLRLQVTPQITPDNRIMLKLAVNQDSRGQQATATSIPAINTQQIETNVLVDNGETLVLGGIYKQEDDDNVTRVPFLSSIPLIGNLFKNNNKSNQESELLIFVTPRIVE